MKKINKKWIWWFTRFFLFFKTTTLQRITPRTRQRALGKPLSVWKNTVKHVSWLNKSENTSHRLPRGTLWNTYTQWQDYQKPRGRYAERKTQTATCAAPGINIEPLACLHNFLNFLCTTVLCVIIKTKKKK